MTLGIVGSAVGCPGTLKDPGEFDFGSEAGTAETGTPACPAAEAAEVPTTIFQPICGIGPCHSATTMLSGLDLVSPGVAQRLIAVPANEMTSLFLIDSANPQGSVIYTKLQAGTVPFGSEMPYNGPPFLSALQVACVLAWIDSVVSDAGPGGSSDAALEASTSSSSEASTSDGSTIPPVPSPTSSPDSSIPTGDSSSSGAVSFATVYNTVMEGTCTSHHSGADPSGGLDLSTEMNAFTNLTTGTSSNTLEVGCDESYVVKGNAAQSLLYKKLVGPPTLPTACGVRMPMGEGPVSAADLALVGDWISSGAAP
jgi:hypothetical protein